VAVNQFGVKEVARLTLGQQLFDGIGVGGLSFNLIAVFLALRHISGNVGPRILV